MSKQVPLTPKQQEIYNRLRDKFIEGIIQKIDQNAFEIAFKNHQENKAEEV